MSMTTRDFLELRRQAVRERMDAGRDPGPAYGNVRPLLWYDQFFASALPLVDTVDCPVALRVGNTQNALDIVVVANHANTEDLVVPEGTSITLVLLESDSPDAVFTERGPSFCVVAPSGGMSAEPGSLLLRFPAGCMEKPWCKVRLVVNGTVSGGVVDVALAYRPR